MKVIKRKICYLDAPCNIAVMTHQALHLLVKIYILVDALIYTMCAAKCYHMRSVLFVCCFLSQKIDGANTQQSVIEERTA